MKFLAVKLPLIIIFLTCFVTIVEASEPSEIGNFYEPSEIVVQDEVRELFVNSAIKREMGKNELHVYSFRGESGKCLHLSVEQQGTDVIVTLVSPSNQTLAFVERANTLQGPENLTFVLPEDGIYTVKIQSGNWVEIKNGYTIELKPFSVPNEIDLKRIEAEKLVSEADSLSFDSKRRVESVEKFNRAIALWDELGEEYEKTVAYYGIGWTYINEGDFENAAIAFGKAAEDARRSGENFMLAHSLRGAAIANSNLGEYVSAVIYSQESISIFRAFEMPRYVGTGLQSLGYAHYFLEDYPNALRSFNEALDYRRKAKDQNGEILTLTALVKTHSRLENYALALQLIEQAKQKTENAKLSTKTEILIEEGWTLIFLKRFADAEKPFTEALKNYQTENSVSGQAIAYCGLGIIKQNKKQLKEALSDIEKSLELIESLREKLSDNAFRLSFSATNQSYYEIYINLLMQFHQIYPNENFDAKAFEASEKARARVLLDLVSESGFLSQRNLPPELKNKLQVTQTRYSANLKEWKRLSRTKNDATLKDLNLQIQTTVLEKRKLEAEVKSKFAGKPEFQAFHSFSADGIQNLLDDDTILLEFGLYKNNYGSENSYLWAVTKDKIKGFTLPSRISIEQKVNRAYQLLTVRNNFSASLSEREKQLKIKQAENEYQQVSGELSKMLLEPLVKENLLKSKKKLLIVSNGILQSLPFAALPNPFSTNKAEYLISNFEIVNLPSASILGALREREKNRIAPDKTALVLADPVFSEKDERFSAVNLPSKSSVTVNSKSVLRLADYFTNDDLPRLFNTRFEAEKISSFLPPAQKRVELDFNATVESVTKTDLSNYRILHFATHALIDDETPELSGIVLSMFDNKRQPREGFLLSGDIFELKLNADLVVLSGCRTGLGKPVRGEGFVGLTQSFMYAGASRLLTSLWSVEDRATAQLMANFYKYHLAKKMSAAAALKEAQKEMSKNPRWQSPYYWAAFTLQGEYK